jgi:hypothetical protein
MLGQDFLAVGRKYRTVDIWEWQPQGWRLIYVLQPALLLEERDARTELGTAKTRYYSIGRIFRLWTWDQYARRWTLTEQS